MEIIHKMMLAIGLVFYQILNSHFSFRRKGEELKQKMARMKPIIVPSASRIEINSPTQEKKDVSKEDVDTLDDLSKREFNNVPPIEPFRLGAQGGVDGAPSRDARFMAVCREVIGYGDSRSKTTEGHCSLGAKSGQ